ncbi:hypothetical protein B0H14DRAFT_1625248 [Mycena olivaceomarginata]|nr:hypothetical protein B0H14DRAFT_1625248 [Mycena olivaceomarginata]
MCAEHAEDGRNDMADVEAGGGGQRAHEYEQGPLRGYERAVAPAPGELCAARAGGHAWVGAHCRRRRRWSRARGRDRARAGTSTLRVSVMGALHAVTGVGAPREEGDDGLTRAPSMQRERREEGMGWQRRYAREEGEWEQGLDTRCLVPPHPRHTSPTGTWSLRRSLRCSSRTVPAGPPPTATATE